MQCCGDPFQLGGPVSWKLSPKVDSDFLANVVGLEVVNTLTDAYENPGDMPDETQPTPGTITSIRAAFCEYAPVPTDSRSLYPLAGSGVLEPRSGADGWEPESGPRRFVGYVVEVDCDEA